MTTYLPIPAYVERKALSIMLTHIVLDLKCSQADAHKLNITC
jgi:hypothetical protein